jgi:hypothetical protein
MVFTQALVFTRTIVFTDAMVFTRTIVFTCTIVSLVRWHSLLQRLRREISQPAGFAVVCDGDRVATYFAVLDIRLTA